MCPYRVVQSRKGKKKLFRLGGEAGAYVSLFRTSEKKEKVISLKKEKRKPETFFLILSKGLSFTARGKKRGEKK